MSPKLEDALRWAAVCHDGQVRKGSGAPYIEHPVAVAMILDRLGYDEDVVIAGLLHDVVEDTEAVLDDVIGRFGAEVARIVASCSEVKTDAEGRKRPWIDRKRDHLDALKHSPPSACAVMLADKLHNLVSIETDLRAGRAIWSQFNADRALVLWYYQAVIDCAGTADPRLDALAIRCREVLAVVEAL